MSAWEANGKSDDWLTPRYVFVALGINFDLDVATFPPGVKTRVPAHARIHENSLDKEWRGTVWMNPPFGARNEIVPWLEKFFAHGDGVALVPDRTSAPWFQRFARQADAILFVSPKIKFERPDGSIGRSPGCGTALLAKGWPAQCALMNACVNGLGMIVKNVC